MARADARPTIRTKVIGITSRFLGDSVFVEDENTVRLEVKVPGNSCAGKEIVHGFVKLNAVWSGLMIEQEIDVGIVFVPHADFNLIGHFKQRMDIAHLPKPGEQVSIEMLMALGADVDGFSKAKRVHRHRRAARIKVFGVGGQYLAVLGFDDVAP